MRPLWPLRVACGLVAVLLVSHTLMVLSAEAEKSRPPKGSTARDHTVYWWPTSVRVTVELARSHTWHAHTLKGTAARAHCWRSAPFPTRRRAGGGGGRTLVFPSWPPEYSTPWSYASEVTPHECSARVAKHCKSPNGKLDCDSRARWRATGVALALDLVREARRQRRVAYHVEAVQAVGPLQHVGSCCPGAGAGARSRARGSVGRAHGNHV